MAEPLRKRKLVVLGIPWDVDTEGLKSYMDKYGDIDDVVVIKDRASNRSRGFGYVTFSSVESVEKALATKHVLNGRVLEVKVATPKEDMNTPSKKITRIFVARIPSQVDEETFRSYFEQFGTITDVYMPKESGSKAHRGIGFITFENSESVGKVMAKTHEIGGSTVAIDKATPKEEPARNYDKGYYGSYGSYSPYVTASAASRYGSYGLSQYPSFDYSGYGISSAYGHAGSSTGYGVNKWSDLSSYSSSSLSNVAGRTNIPGYGSGQSLSAGYDTGNSLSNAVRGGTANKIFVGKLPSDATSDDLQQYFSNFGRVLDVFLPKDSKKPGHRGFGFVTFAERGPADRVTRRSHELLGHQIAVELATPEAGNDTTVPVSGSSLALGSFPASRRDYDFDYTNGWSSFSGGGPGPIMASDKVACGGKSSRIEQRYKPY